MRMKLMIAGSLAFTLLSGQAHAAWSNAEISHAEDTYLGIQYAQMAYENDGPGDYQPEGLVLRLGKDVTKYFSVEARAGSGTKSDAHTAVINGAAVNLEMSIDYLYGLYVTGTFPLSSIFDIYGIAGYTRIKAPATASDKDVDNSVSMGIGVNWKIDNAASLSLEYMSYMYKSDIDLSAISIGISNRF